LPELILRVFLSVIQIVCDATCQNKPKPFFQAMITLEVREKNHCFEKKRYLHRYMTTAAKKVHNLQISALFL